jgi:hypothetical protein
MIIDCSITQDLANENEIWIMDFEFELGEEERTKEIRDNIRELYTLVAGILRGAEEARQYDSAYGEALEGLAEFERRYGAA